MNTYLVADIGGTNARYALASKDSNGYKLSHSKVLACADYPSLSASLDAYSTAINRPLPDSACLAIAGPVSGDEITFSNLDWSFSIKDLQQQFAFKQLQVINDFSAQACSTQSLQAADLRTIKAGTAINNSAKVILGPGTGLGVAAMIATATGHYPVASEGGNIPFAAGSPLEVKILQTLWQSHNHVSLETLLSGQGLVTIYKTLASIYQQPPEDFSPADISHHGLEDSSPLCRQTLSVFCAILGSAAGGFALTFTAVGGVYLAGGILPRIESFLKQSEFKQRFCQQGNMSHYLSDIPVYLITHPQPGLIGAAQWLDSVSVNR